VELHAFARRLALPRRSFQGDHYDLDEILRARAIMLGAQPVPSRELLSRLRDAGLRLPPSARRAHTTDPPARLATSDWMGRQVEVVVDHAVGSPLLDGRPSLINLGHVPGTHGWARLPVAAYLLGIGAPVARGNGLVVAVLRRHDDVEDRVAVADGTSVWDRAAIARAVAGHERWFTSEVLI